MYRLRQADRVRVRQLIEDYDLHSGYLPVDVKQIAVQEGWEIRYRCRLKPLYGYALMGGAVKLMVLNSDVWVGAQRATIAHELGHELLGHRQYVDIFAPRFQDYGLQDMLDRRQEREANLAAAMLLIPPNAVDECGDMDELAAYCHVPLRVVESYFGQETGQWREDTSGSEEADGPSLLIFPDRQARNASKSGTEDLSPRTPPSAG